MANCHNIFEDYNKKIRLSDEKKNELIIIRDNLRKRILDGFAKVTSDIRIPNKIEFQSQGSFVMDTIIKPLHDDYDIDDGVYFIGSLDRDKRHRPADFHKATVMAVDKGHDDIEKIADKSTCVRIKYKEGFHVDLPIYYADNYDLPDLADKERGWTISSPIEFITWFEDKINSGFQKAYLYESKLFDEFQKWTTDIRKNDVQLRRIVRYLKSWADLRREEMPCGLIMTILAANNYYNHEREDVALKETLVNIQAKLHKGFKCERPTTPKGEDLLKNYEHKTQFLLYLDRFVDNAKMGISEPDINKACEYWQKSLGSRFECSNNHNKPGQTYQNIGLATGAFSSKPWSLWIMKAYETFISHFNELSKEFPKFTLEIDQEIPIIKGELDIIDHLGKYWESYKIEIHCTREYPKRFPKLYEVGGKIPKIADWHVYEDSQSCCIKILPEELLICNAGITLIDFVKLQVLPYLFNQTHRRVEGYYVNNGYSHGVIGLYEFYSQKLNSKNIFQIIDMLRFIYKGEEPDRVKMCFCGSNKKYRECHREAFRLLTQLGKDQLAFDIINLDRNKQYFL